MDGCEGLKAAAAAAVVRCMHQKRARNLGSLALFWNLPIPPLPGSRIFHGKMLPRHPEGADLRVKSFLFRLQAARRCRCEPSLEGDAWGNGMQAVIARTAFGRRAGAWLLLAPSSDQQLIAVLLQYRLHSPLRGCRPQSNGSRGHRRAAFHQNEKAIFA